MPPGFDRHEILVMMNSLQNIVISDAQTPPDVDGIKIFDKDDQAQGRPFDFTSFSARPV